jgi:hypothetical protein
MTSYNLAVDRHSSAPVSVGRRYHARTTLMLAGRRAMGNSVTLFFWVGGPGLLSKFQNKPRGDNSSAQSEARVGIRRVR